MASFVLDSSVSHYISRKANEMSKVWVFADYSQAESRVVAWHGPIPLMKQWFVNKEDIHLNTAKVVGKFVNENKIRLPQGLFSKPWEELTKKDAKERYVGKQTNHANNYGLGKITFSLRTGLPVKYAALIQDVYFATFPEVKTGYQARIVAQLKKDRTLVNPWGWKRCFYDIYGPELERAAWAWFAQSTIGILTLRMLKLVCTLFKQDLQIWTPENIRSMGLDVQLDVHDSIGVVCEDTEVVEVVRLVKSTGEYPLVIGGEEVIIPLDFKIGDNWKDLHDYEP